MLAIYLLLGFFIGSQTSRKMQNKNNKEDPTATGQVETTNDKNNRNNKNNTNNQIKRHNVKVRKKIKRYFTINSNNPEAIDPDKISVDIKKKTQERNKSSPEPSFIALSILWAHYIANQLGILKEKGPSPWQITFEKDDSEILKKQTNLDISRNSWRTFLSKIIIDKSWTSWIKKPDEVKKRTLLAFEN